MIDFTAVQAAYVALYVQLFPAVSSGAWTTWEPAQRQALNDVVHTLDGFVSDTIRTVYDRQVWDGNKRAAFVGNTAIGLDPKKADEVTPNKLRPVRRQKSDSTTTATETLTVEQMALASIKATTVAVTEEAPADE